MKMTRNEKYPIPRMNVFDSVWLLLFFFCFCFFKLLLLVIVLLVYFYLFLKKNVQKIGSYVAYRK